MTFRILPDKSLCLGILLVRFFITLSLEATKGCIIDCSNSIYNYFCTFVR